MGKMEQRSFEIREVTNEGKLIGYAAVWDSLSGDLGGFREKIKPGAFTRSLKENPDIRAFFDHDKSKVLGRTKNGTLKLTEDERGLRAEIDVPNVQWAQDLREQVRRGDIDSMSFGFIPVRDSWEERDGVMIRTLEDVDLIEVSVVTFPAYQATSVQARNQQNKGEDNMEQTVIKPEVKQQDERREVNTKTPQILTREQKIASVVPRIETIKGENLFGAYVRGLATGNWASEELRTMSEGTATAGGYLVPAPLAAGVIDKARAASVVFRAGARTVPMTSQTLTMARITSDPTAQWLAENAAQTPSDMSFGQLKFTAQTLRALTTLSVELAEDAANIDQIIENAMSKVFAAEIDRVALLGSGTAPEPRGIVNVSGINTQSMGTNGAALSNYDPFVDAIQKIMDANGPSSGLAAIYAPRTEAAMAKLKDSTNQPLQKPSLVANLQMLPSQKIPTNMTQGTSNNASLIIVGDFSQLLIGMRTDLTIEVSRQAGSAFSNLQILIRGYMRADVQVAQPSFFTLINGVL